MAVSAVLVSVVVGSSVVVVEMVVGEKFLCLKFLGGLRNLGRWMEGWIMVSSIIK